MWGCGTCCCGCCTGRGCGRTPFFQYSRMTAQWSTWTRCCKPAPVAVFFVFVCRVAGTGARVHPRGCQCLSPGWVGGWAGEGCVCTSSLRPRVVNDCCSLFPAVYGVVASSLRLGCFPSSAPGWLLSSVPPRDLMPFPRTPLEDFACIHALWHCSPLRTSTLCRLHSLPRRSKKSEKPPPRLACPRQTSKRKLST